MKTLNNNKFSSFIGRGGSFLGGSLFKLLALLIILFLTIPSYAQTNFQWEWFATGGKYCGMGSEIKDIVCDDSGNVYGIGTSTGSSQIFGSDTIKSLGNDDIIIFKYDSSGNVKWGKIFGGASWEQGYSIVLDKQGNIFICGGFHDSTYIDNIKLKSNGWYDVFFAKLNNAGEAIWAKNYGSASQDRGVKLAIDSQDNIYMLGYEYCVSGSTSITIDNNTASLQCGEMFLAKFNATGICLWNKRVGGTGQASLEQDMKIFNDSFIYIIGLYDKTFTIQGTTLYNSDYLKTNVFLEVFDANGNLKKVKQIGNTNSHIGYPEIEIDKNKNIHLAIQLFGDTVTFDTTIVATDSKTAFKGVYLQIDTNYNVVNVEKYFDCSRSAFTIDDNNNTYMIGEIQNTTIIIGKDSLTRTNEGLYLIKQNEERNKTLYQLYKLNNLYLSHLGLKYFNNNIYVFGNLNIGTIAQPWFLDLDTNHITDVGWFITKIKQIDSTTVGIDNGKLTMENRELTIFPNPANDKLYIKTTSQNPNIFVEIHNIYGQLLIDNEKLIIDNGLGVVNINHLDRGIYFVKIGNKTSKFIKQ